MIGLRQTIERGMLHPLLGPFLVLVFFALLVLTALRAVHHGEHMATEIGHFCLGVVTLFSFLIVIRLAWWSPTPRARQQTRHAPPGMPLLGPPHAKASPASVLLRA